MPLSLPEALGIRESAIENQSGNLTYKVFLSPSKHPVRKICCWGRGGETT